MKNCPACGKSVSEYLSKCPNCGSNLKEGAAAKATEKSVAIREKTHAHQKIYLISSFVLALASGTLIPFIFHRRFRWGFMPDTIDILVYCLAVLCSIGVIFKFQLFKKLTKQEIKRMMTIGGIAFIIAALLSVFIPSYLFNRMMNPAFYSMRFIINTAISLLSHKPIFLITSILHGLVWVCIAIQGFFLLKLKEKAK